MNEDIKGLIAKTVKEEFEEGQKRRRDLLATFPRPKLRREHFADTIVLPSRLHLLDDMPNGGIMCEVGVASGSFSQEILKRCSPRELHLVDAWTAYRYAHCIEDVEAKFKVEIESKKVQLHRGYSTEQLAKFPDEYFDWIYIDTVHDYKITSEELHLSLKKIKRGGIIAGHDYAPGNCVTPVVWGVIQAVQEFCLYNDWKFAWLTAEFSGGSTFALKAMG